MKITSNVGNNPRLNPEAIWVGVDIELPISIASCKSAEEMVTHFCEKFLGLDINNIIWATVNKSTDNGIEYAISYKEKDEHWVNTSGGFIYTTVDKVMHDYAVRKIDACILDEVFTEFERQVAAYNDWVNNCIETDTPASVMTDKEMTDKERFLEGCKYTVMKPEMAEVVFGMCGGWDEFKTAAPRADDYSIIDISSILFTASIKGVDNTDEAVALYQNNQKLILEWLVDEANKLEYEDVIEFINGDRDARNIPNVKPPQYSDAEVATALFCFNSEAHKWVAQKVVRLAMQLLSHDYGSFLRNS